MPRKWLPDNVTQWHDRHGKARYRFRKSGLPSYNFRSPPGTPEFMAELQAARTAIPEAIQRAAPFTYDALIASFYRTAKWQQMSDSSQRTYRGIIERFRAKNGAKDVRRVTAAAIDAKLGKMADTPAAANNLRKVLSRLHRHAIKLDWRTDNPVAATDALAIEGDGHHTWTEAEIAAYEAQWPLGTRERLAMALMLYTALRKSDMVTLGKQHRVGDTFRLRQKKTGGDVVIPIIPPLALAIDAMTSQHLTYLVTEFGRPFTANGFGNWFRRKCDKAGLPHCSAHGLRKAMARRLAEAGVTNLQGRAITGHKTDKLFNHYAAKASQETLAGAAMDKLMANRDD